MFVATAYGSNTLVEWLPTLLGHRGAHLESAGNNYCPCGEAWYHNAYL